MAGVTVQQAFESTRLATDADGAPTSEELVYVVRGAHEEADAIAAVLREAPKKRHDKALSLTPKGDHIIKICNGTACHLRGAMNLATELKRDLGIDPGETTDDGAFSVELVNCLGSCALAPVMVVDGTYHNKLRVEQIPGIQRKIIHKCIAKKKPVIVATQI